MRKGERLYIPSLDGIRAVSFLGVFASHIDPQHIRVPGPFGVTVFFFLSGYLITTLLRMEFANHGRIDLKAFYIRRAFRILPPFYVVLLAASLLALVLGHQLGLGGMLTKALHFANYWIVVNGWDETPPGTTGYWSLAVEEHFYLLFPSLYIALCKFVPRQAYHAACILGLCALVLAWRCVLAYGFQADVLRTYVASDTRMDSILFGCALAAYGNPVLDGPSKIAPALWKWVLFPAGCLLILASFLFHDMGLRETIRYSMQGIGLFPIFIAAIRFPEWGPFRLLNIGWVRFLGVLSYSLYLLHDVVLFTLKYDFGFGRVACALIGLPLSFALAYAIYRFVEKPCARARQRWSQVAHQEPALRAS